MKVYVDSWKASTHKNVGCLESLQKMMKDKREGKVIILK
jgi:hypothetical protein